MKEPGFCGGECLESAVRRRGGAEHGILVPKKMIRRGSNGHRGYYTVPHRPSWQNPPPPPPTLWDVLFPTDNTVLPPAHVCGRTRRAPRQTQPRAVPNHRRAGEGVLWSEGATPAPWPRPFSRHPLPVLQNQRLGVTPPGQRGCRDAAPLRPPQGRTRSIQLKVEISHIERFVCL